MKALAPLRRRVAMMVGRAVLAAVDDARKCQTVQLTLLADEIADGVERFQNYGFSSVPFPQAEAIVVSVGGLRSHSIAIAVEDRRYRPTGQEPGVVTVFDDQGQKITLKRGGVEIETTLQVKVIAPKVVVQSDNVCLGAEGGPAVARVGDPVSGGVITAGSSRVKAA